MVAEIEPCETGADEGGRWTDRQSGTAPAALVLAAPLMMAVDDRWVAAGADTGMRDDPLI
mgnify:CR=1 FL=1